MGRWATKKKENPISIYSIWLRLRLDACMEILLFFVSFMMSVCDASTIPITREKSIVSASVNPFQSSHSNHIPHNTQNIANFPISIEHNNIHIWMWRWIKSLRNAIGHKFLWRELLATIFKSVLFHLIVGDIHYFPFPTGFASFVVEKNLYM